MGAKSTGTSSVRAEAGQTQKPVQAQRPAIDRDRANGELSYIAGCTARDHSVLVLIGEQGGGSFADLESKVLVLDPESCANDPQFIAAHEGAHIGETVSPKALGRTPEQIRELAGRIGFHALHNVVEDGAINDIFSRAYPVLQLHTLAAYPRVSPTDEVGFIALPEVIRLAQLLGRVPLYAQALSAILVDWSETRHELGFDVSFADLKDTPLRGGKLEHLELKRFFKDVLPEIRDAISKIPQPGATGDERFEKSVERFLWCEKVIYPHLKKLIDIDLKDLKQQLQQGQQGQQGQQDQQGQQGQEGQTGQQQRGAQGQNGQPNQQSSHGAGPVKESEAARQAREMIAEVDDAIRTYLESWKDQAEGENPSASEVIKSETQAERQAEAEAETAQEEAGLAKSLGENLLASLSPYHREYHEIAETLEDAHGRLGYVFDPERHFKWRKEESTGSRLDMTRAMKFELTGEGHRQIWMKRIDPQYPDMDLVILLDRSGSMGSEERYVAARRGLIFARELFVRLNIRTACVGFANEPEFFVDFEDDISEPEVQAQIIENTTPLKEGTNDAKGVEFAANLLKEREAEHRAIIVLSDAESGQSAELKKRVAELHAEGIPVLHFGLGGGTKDAQGNYLLSWGDLSLQDKSATGFLGVFCREMGRLAEGALEER